MEVYLVIEFDYDGKFSDAQVFTVYEQASDFAREIHSRGGESEILARNVKSA